MANIIKTTVKPTVITSTLDRYSKCKEWFESNGFNFSATRYGIALKVNNKIMSPTIDEKYIKACITIKINNIENKIRIPTIEELWQIIELQDLYEIYTYLEDEKSDTLANTFKKSLGGSRLLSEESKTTARDFFFELKTASRFKKSNMEIYFDEKPDILVKKNECTYHIECKRIQSLHSLSKNIKKALDQFNEAGVEKSKRIISVDFSKYFFNEYPIDVNKIATMDIINAVKKEFDQFINVVIDEENKHIMDNISIFLAHIRFPAILLPFNIISVNHFTLIRSSSNGSDCAKSIAKLLHGSVGIT